MLPQQIVCPTCQQNKIRKVTGIHSAGITKEQRNYRDSDGYPTSENITVQTGLSKRLEPPSKPIFKNPASCQDWTIGFSVILVWLMGIVLTIHIVHSRFLLSRLSWEIPFIAFSWILTIVRTMYVRKRLLMRKELFYAQDYTSWERAMTRWNALYYCEVCDVVFLPGQNDTVSADQTREFVYRIQ